MPLCINRYEHSSQYLDRFYKYKVKNDFINTNYGYTVFEKKNMFKKIKIDLVLTNIFTENVS